VRNGLSLTPGFSPVQSPDAKKNRLNGFHPQGKPLKRLALGFAAYTRLKPGVNEMSETATRRCESMAERSLSAESDGHR
jgi:hypothetical protein